MHTAGSDRFFCISLYRKKSVHKRSLRRVKSIYGGTQFGVYSFGPLGRQAHPDIACLRWPAINSHAGSALGAGYCFQAAAPKSRSSCRYSLPLRFIRRLVQLPNSPSSFIRRSYSSTLLLKACVIGFCYF